MPIIVPQSVKLIGLMRPLENLDPPGKLIERAGRVCYKSEDKITENSYIPFVDKICNQFKHESVAEHSGATFHIVTNRAIGNELVRHRIASYSQESTRYVNYTQARHGKCITVIEPDFNDNKASGYWWNAVNAAETAYFNLIDCGVKPELARDILPLCLKTEIVATMNFRSWKHVLQLRLDNAAHYQFRQLAKIIHGELMKVSPEYFSTIVVP